MFNDILANIGGFMAQLRIPTLLGQGILAVVELFLTVGQFMIDMIVRGYEAIF